MREAACARAQLSEETAMLLTNRIGAAPKPRHTAPSRRAAVAALAAFTITMAMAAGYARAEGGPRTGQEVVDAVCAKCHATGANGAPKIGDDKAWSKRAAQGLTGLTREALKGVRQMPSHGGNPGLSDFEIQRAITYMVNQSGGHWSEPIDKAAAPRTRSGEQIVQAQCAKCHQTGVGGAPRIGDRSAWIPRLKGGYDPVVRSAINGHGGMPARGGMASLTDAELRSAINYMIGPDAPAPK
jgi:cytochrome c5